eukprot:TRINITY_DN13096_c0_g1_i8.p1 TRINITY_DN13096_c0_g1~~TRINITY_DN13096_c0_g1_i8.p1  ORF type:complete len:1018 (+),score=183.92 TRINITY_DN13096_c0_g1_i8:129-3182(+)
MASGDGFGSGGGYSGFGLSGSKLDSGFGFSGSRVDSGFGISGSRLDSGSKSEGLSASKALGLDDPVVSTSKQAEEWEQKIRSLDKEEKEVHHSQLRIIRDQTLHFVRDLGSLRNDFIQMRSAMDTIQSALEQETRERVSSVATTERVSQDISREATTKLARFDSVLPSMESKVSTIEVTVDSLQSMLEQETHNRISSVSTVERLHQDLNRETSQKMARVMDTLLPTVENRITSVGESLRSEIEEETRNRLASQSTYEKLYQENSQKVVRLVDTMIPTVETKIASTEERLRNEMQSEVRDRMVAISNVERICHESARETSLKLTRAIDTMFPSLETKIVNAEERVRGDVMGEIAIFQAEIENISKKVRGELAAEALSREVNSESIKALESRLKRTEEAREEDQLRYSTKLTEIKEFLREELSASDKRQLRKISEIESSQKMQAELLKSDLSESIKRMTEESELSQSRNLKQIDQVKEDVKNSAQNFDAKVEGLTVDIASAFQQINSTKDDLKTSAQSFDQQIRSTQEDLKASAQNISAQFEGVERALKAAEELISDRTDKLYLQLNKEIVSQADGLTTRLDEVASSNARLQKFLKDMTQMHDQYVEQQETQNRQFDERLDSQAKSFEARSTSIDERIDSHTRQYNARVASIEERLDSVDAIVEETSEKSLRGLENAQNCMTDMQMSYTALEREKDGLKSKLESLKERQDQCDQCLGGSYVPWIGQRRSRNISEATDDPPDAPREGNRSFSNLVPPITDRLDELEQSQTEAIEMQKRFDERLDEFQGKIGDVDHALRTHTHLQPGVVQLGGGQIARSTSKPVMTYAAPVVLNTSNVPSFDELDADGDGVITREELAQSMANRGRLPSNMSMSSAAAVPGSRSMKQVPVTMSASSSSLPGVSSPLAGRPRSPLNLSLTASMSTIPGLSEPARPVSPLNIVRTDGAKPISPSAGKPRSPSIELPGASSPTRLPIPLRQPSSSLLGQSGTSPSTSFAYGVAVAPPIRSGSPSNASFVSNNPH